MIEKPILLSLYVQPCPFYEEGRKALRCILVADNPLQFGLTASFILHPWHCYTTNHISGLVLLAQHSVLREKKREPCAHFGQNNLRSIKDRVGIRCQNASTHWKKDTFPSFQRPFIYRCTNWARLIGNNEVELSTYFIAYFKWHLNHFFDFGVKNYRQRK